MKTKPTVEIDAETIVPQFGTMPVHRVAKFLSVSAQHLRNLIEDGDIKVPADELQRVKRKEKPWTLVRVPRESLVEFIRQRTARRRHSKK